MTEDERKKRPEVRVFEYLKDRENGATPSQIAEQLGMHYDTVKDVCGGLMTMEKVDAVETDNFVVYRSVEA